MYLFRRYLFPVVIFCFGTLLWFGCIDLNDFSKISKNVELEISAPLYQSTAYVDSFVVNNFKGIQVGPGGIYYLERKGSPLTTYLNSFWFDYNLGFAEIKLGPYTLFDARNEFQTKLYDEGFVKTILSNYVNIFTVTPSIQAQFRSIHVKKGHANVTLINDFDREADVILEYRGITDVASGGFITKTYTLSPNSQQSVILPLENHLLNLSNGPFGFNQLEVVATITIEDLTAKGNSARSVIGSFSNVTIKTVIDIDSIYNLSGAIPNHQISDISIEMPIKSLNLSSIFNDSYRKNIELRNSIIAININSYVKEPIALKLQNFKATFFTGKETPIPSRNPELFHELSYPAFSQGDIQPVENQLIIDDNIVEESLMRSVLFDPDLSSLSLDLNLGVSPVKASLKDSLAPASIGYSISLFAPMRLDVNGLEVQELSFDNTHIISQLEKIFNDVSQKVSKIELAVTLENYSPFTIKPQYYVYKNAVLVDSLIKPEVGQDFIDGSPIDNNGLMIETAVVPKTFVMEITKNVWEKIKYSDALMFILKLNSVKSSKIPYVLLSKNQRIRFKLKARKIVFSVPLE